MVFRGQEGNVHFQRITSGSYLLFVCRFRFFYILIICNYLICKNECAYMQSQHLLFSPNMSQVSNPYVFKSLHSHVSFVS